MSRPLPAPLRPSLLLALALALLLVLPALSPAGAKGAGSPAVHSVVLDLVEDVPAGAFAFAPCGDRAAFVPVDGGFRFEERQSVTGEATPYPGGYLALGCGEARLDRVPPAGASLVEVRFLADRTVDEFNVDGNSVTRPGRQFEQEVQFRTGDGTGDRRVPYMDPATGSVPAGPILLDAFLLPRGAGNFSLAWSFRDASYFVGPGFQDVLSGQAFSATVTGVQLRYLGLPVASDVADRIEREGSLLVGRTRVQVDVQDPGAADLRVEVARGLAYDHLRTPEGARIEAQATRVAAGPDGFDRQAVLVEASDDGSTQVTVPRELLAANGAGEYTLSFRSLDPVKTHPWLLPAAVLAMLAPLPFAFVAYLHVRRFEAEAFGGFRRSARNLRVALVVAFAYYVAVLLSHFLGSRLELMTAWPLPMEAVLLYVQVAIAVGAFLALYAVARELYQITVPKALPDLPAPPAPLPEDPDQ